eukprot:TRINITY_DN448_c0_g3_i1.p1 TRINITY_DN448_c0_g3~~TRINITY_DN448_c0_g3_i1.p1  ORF type:complete len:576 (+),score=155.19 TRINITY_DN448_c0_g3_i1:41-1729(+)
MNAEERKKELLTNLTPCVKQMLEISKDLDLCISSTKELGKINTDAALRAIQAFPTLQTDLENALVFYSLESGVGGAALNGFVNFQLKATIHLLVTAIKKAIGTLDLSDLEKQAANFRSHPRTLVDMIKGMSFADPDEIDDATENEITPDEVNLPTLVMILTNYPQKFGNDKMRLGRQVFQLLKQKYKGSVAALRVKREDGETDLKTPFAKINDIKNHINFEELRGYPYFILIKDGRYHWYRNLQFEMKALDVWVRDIVLGMAHVTGVVDESIVTERVRYFWKMKTGQKEHMTNTLLSEGHPRRQNMIEMGETPDIMDPLWFVAVEQDGSVFFMQSLLEFQAQFKKLLHPRNPTKDFTYLFVIPSLAWPGWRVHRRELDTPETITIDTPIQFLRRYLVLNEKGIPFDEFRKFFEGDDEELVELAPDAETFDIDEFGDIGGLEWSGEDVDDSDINLDGMGKEAMALAKAELALAGAHGEEVKRNANRFAGDLSITVKDTYDPMNVPRPAGTRSKIAEPKPRAAPGTQGVQDTLFDYLGDMLEANVLGFDEDEFGESIEDVDLGF